MLQDGNLRIRHILLLPFGLVCKLVPPRMYVLRLSFEHPPPEFTSVPTIGIAVATAFVAGHQHHLIVHLTDKTSIAAPAALIYHCNTKETLAAGTSIQHFFLVGYEQ